MRIKGVSGGVAPQMRGVQTVFVYDPADGKVVHVHHLVLLEGMEIPPATDQVEAALEAAHRVGHDRAKVAGLHVGALELNPYIVYSVDPKDNTLVEKDSGAS